jgi:lipopolysaccharide transport system ATP-binding protein
MSSEIAIQVDKLNKRYQIYAQPHHRLKQFVLPRLQRALGGAVKNYFSEFWAVKDISFEIKKGETVGIVGRNGSGKSTLLQMICGTLNPSGGSINTNGRIAALLELGAGFNPEFSGRENVYLNAAVLGLSKAETNARFDEIAKFADIGDFIEHPVKTYSSGMTVRLAFAVAINVDPQILIIDEALSVGDELFQRKCFARIETIKKGGATILFVSHSGATIIELCDRAILLDDGELLASSTPKSIVSKYQKLLYAPPGERTLVRNEVIRNQDSADPKIVIDEKAATIEPHQIIEDFFDPFLKPSSTLAFRPQGAHITDPMIETENGRQVNNLTRGSDYVYRYQVQFSQTAYRVRFGMVIRTTTGFSLGGALSASSEDVIAIVESGTMLSVEFSFHCSLNPGTYFVNAGVFGCIEQEEIILHRLVDAISFRVNPVVDNLATEVIHFSCKPYVKIHV